MLPLPENAVGFSTWTEIEGGFGFTAGPADRAMKATHQHALQIPPGGPCASVYRVPAHRAVVQLERIGAQLPAQGVR